MPWSWKPLVAGPLAAAWLAGCATTAVVPPCCYVGEVTMARLGQVEVVNRDGSRLPVGEALPGWSPDPRFVTRAPPFPRADIAQVVLQSLTPVLPLYDANRNG